MKSALQTQAIEQEYETFDGVVRVRRYYHWGRRAWITRRLVDPGRREPVRLDSNGYSPLRLTKTDERNERSGRFRPTD